MDKAEIKEALERIVEGLKSYDADSTSVSEDPVYYIEDAQTQLEALIKKLEES